MRRLSSLCAATSLALLAVLASAAVAFAASPLQEYQRTGTITPCKYGAGQLGGGVPNDVNQYAPEYKAQLEAAARARARGCGSGGGNSSSKRSTSGAAAGSGGHGGGKKPHSASSRPSSVAPVVPPIDPTAASAGSTAQPAKPAAATHRGTSDLLLVVLILGGLVVLGGALALIGRYLGWSPRWLSPAAHALREAGLRIGTTAAGFVDWARPSPRSS